jgi:hypothetical protein
MFNHTQIKRLLPALLAVGVTALPSAATADMLTFGSGAGVGPAAEGFAPVHQAVPRGQSGFSWADAGIGAAGAIVLLGAGFGGAGTVTTRRRRVTSAT